MNDSAENPPIDSSSVREIVGRGLRRRCPHCGEASIFDRRRNVRAECPHCGLRLLPQPGDAFGFMYISAAVVTGLYVVGFYFGRMWTMPWSVRLTYLAVGIALMVGLASVRTGLAVALDYLTRVRWGDPDEAVRLNLTAASRAGTPEGETRGSDADASRASPGKR